MADPSVGLPVDIEQLGDTSEIRTRPLRGVLRILVQLLGAGMAAYHILQLGGFFFGRAADFADHDDGFGLRIAEEQLQDIDEFGALDRVAADADASALA